MRWLRDLFKPLVFREPPPRPEGQSCMNCNDFEYCDPDDLDGCDGYCTNPTGHEEYGGHWTWHGSWCELWEPTGGGVHQMRLLIRLKALESADAVDAVDPVERTQGADE